MNKGRTDIIPDIDLTVEIGILTTITEIEETTKIRTTMVKEIIEIGAEIHRMTDPILEGKILAKGMIKDIGIEVPVENVVDPDQGIEALQEKILKIGIEIIKVEAEKDNSQQLLPQKETQGQGQDPVLESLLIEIG